MKLTHLTVLAAVGLGVTACSSLSNMERSTELSDPFNEHLRHGYIELADWERDQGDFVDGRWYEKKVEQLLAGNRPTPTALEEWELPTEHLNELAQARNGLVAALASGATTAQPKAAAKAQTMFDCWVEQSEENFQPEHIERCKTGFFAAMSQLKANVDTAAPAPVVTKDAQAADFIVFFDFDKSELTYGATRALDEAASYIKSVRPRTVVVSGHADRSGSNSYNMNLAQKRAITVADYLAQQGIPRPVLAVRSFGEARPRVETTDGVRNPENRYVKITLMQ